MRRSAAPSRKFNSPVSSLNTSLYIMESETPEENAYSDKTQQLNSSGNKKEQQNTLINKMQQQNTLKNKKNPNLAARSTSSILNILKSGTKNSGNDEVPTETTVEKSSSKTLMNESELSAQKENIVQNCGTNKKVYSILWRKQTGKKHKTWEGDGTLEVENRSIIVRDADGKDIGRLNNMKTELFEDGYIFSIGSKDVQICELLPNGTPAVISNKRPNSEPEERCSPRPFKKPKNKSSSPTVLLPFKGVIKRKENVVVNYEPLVMPQPPAEHQWKFNNSKKSIVDVLVDPCLAKVLRPHQRCGIVFLYECVMGFKHPDYFGAILADEMGLGKTLQCITLIWTLLKQGPYGGIPVVCRVLIVTPSSLTGNWEKEFLGWLGREKIRVFVVDAKNKPNEYANTSHIPILIISYEMFVRCFDDLSPISFSLIICDEGHRLKNNSIRAAVLLNQLECKRRIILTGTPIQNDLQEYYSLSEFVNPSFLGSITDYRKYFEEPIVKSREPDADEEVKHIGVERAKELNQKTSSFILRRTQDVLDKYLPTKTEVVVFCKSSVLQQELYKTTVECWENRDMSSKEITHLSVITALKKICNHPNLLRQNEGSQDVEDESVNSRLCETFSESNSKEEMSVSSSGKLKVLMELIKKLHASNEKIVVVSSYTQTLDLIATMCDRNSHKYCRLDGSVPSSQRSKIVERFNSQWSKDLVFLLSAKAGGVGLNLVGASRLVLFDSDWNPATDLQAMSRVWRDGQKKSVFLYRFLTAGTIEEKIYQRQISKTGLSGTVVDPQNTTSICMSDEELKDLFTMQFDADCSTHSVLNCECACDGIIPASKEFNANDNDDEERSCQLGVQNTTENTRNLKMNQLMQWEHYKYPFRDSVVSELGFREVVGDISFIFRNKCTL